MLSTTIRYFTLAAAAVVLAAGLPAASTDAAGWTRVAPGQFHFSVMMPAAPEYEASPVKTEEGSVTMNIYQVVSGDRQYGVCVSEHSAAPSDPRTAVDRVAVSMVGDGRLVASKTFTIGGYPGRMIKVEGAGWTMYGRFIMAKNRLYQLLFMSTRPDETPDSAATFLDSFQLTD